MNLQIKYEAMPKYLAVSVSGTWILSDAKRLIEAIRDEADNCGQTRLFLDAIELSPPDSDVTRFYTGVHIAQILPAPFKLAVVGKKDNINFLGENTAVNRGAIMKVFWEQESAYKWLLG